MNCRVSLSRSAVTTVSPNPALCGIAVGRNHANPRSLTTGATRAASSPPCWRCPAGARSACFASPAGCVRRPRLKMNANNVFLALCALNGADAWDTYGNGFKAQESRPQETQTTALICGQTDANNPSGASGHATIGMPSIPGCDIDQTTVVHVQPGQT